MEKGICEGRECDDRDKGEGVKMTKSNIEI